ncbi:MAG: serine/threonine-protein kinase, partial [Chloroflexota bacterium]
MVHHIPINRRYKILNHIGEGGMGAVYQAWDRLTRSSVALKSVRIPQEPQRLNQNQTALYDGGINLDHTFLYEETATEKLLSLAHEFQILSTLRHPNIISVIDYGFSVEGAPFYTMDYLKDGTPIDQIGRSAPFQTQIQLIEEMLQALTYLHRRDILHRDLKPGNVLVSAGKTKVLDFGLSNLKDKGYTSGGTLAYLAPELVQGREASAASDLYAVGIIAYEIFAGFLPFEPGQANFLLSVLEEDPQLDYIEAPAPVINVVRRLLEKQPEDRYATAESALFALSRAANRELPKESIHIRESFLQAATFTGREQEEQIVTQHIQQTRVKKGAALLIGGESGVGKSRLIRETRTKALVEGLLVLDTQVKEEEGVGFAIWEPAIERLALEVDLDDHTISVLKPIAPNLETLLERKVADAPALPEDLAEQRLITAILSLFQDLERGAMVIVEDLHWYHGDYTFLNRLINLTKELALVFVGSYRHDEAPSLHKHLPGTKSIRLERFSPVDIASLSHAMLGEIGLKPEIQTLLM